jgi:hypothetical protein
VPRLNKELGWIFKQRAHIVSQQHPGWKCFKNWPGDVAALRIRAAAAAAFRQLSFVSDTPPMKTGWVTARH